MDPRQRAIQAALQLRDELPAMTGDDWPELDARFAALLQAAIEAAGGPALAALLQFVRSRPDWAARFDELVGGGWKGGVAPQAPAIPDADAFTAVEVLYATDRAPSGAQHVRQWYTGLRHPAAAIEVGRCVVTIPRRHERGALESPGLLEFWRGEDSKRHVVLATIEPLSPAAFGDRAAAQLGAHSAEALVFVHGYNVSFHDGVRRAAQLAHDLAFDGIRLCFSWPSRGEFLGYAADGDSAEWAAPHLAEVIRRLRALKAGLRIHLVAHSMGNRVLARALQELHWKGEAPAQSIRQVALAAPDIDRDVFDRLADALRSSARRVTLYASSNDRALWVSKLLHRGPRAGDAGAAIAVVDGIDAIDASRVDSSLVGLNHGYFAGKLSVLSDLTLLLRTDTPPAQRPGLVAAADGRHWWMRP